MLFYIHVKVRDLVENTLHLRNFLLPFGDVITVPSTKHLWVL